MGEVAQGGRTVLFVSHNMGAVGQLCHYGLLLTCGQVQAHNGVKEVVQQYLQGLEHCCRVDLLAVSQRQGEGRVKLESVEIRCGVGDTKGPVVVGGPAQFVFRLAESGNNLNCTFTVYDQTGQPIVCFKSSLIAPIDKTESNLVKTIVCEVEEVLLLPGRYRINVAVSDIDGLQDRVEGAAFFDVEQGTVRGRLVQPSEGYGHVVMPHRWQFKR